MGLLTAFAFHSAVTAKLISVFDFTTNIVQSVFYLNPKFQDYSVQAGLCQPGLKPKLFVCFLMQLLHVLILYTIPLLIDNTQCKYFLKQVTNK